MPCLMNLFLTLAATVAMNGDWPMYRGDPMLQGRTADTLSLPLELKWRFKTGDMVKASPVVVGKTVFIGSLDSSMYAVNTETHRKLWEFKASGGVEATALTLGDLIYFGTEEGTMHALRMDDGTPAWNFSAEDRILGAANFAFHSGLKKNTILFGSYDSNLYCLEADSGTLVWKFQTENYINGTPTVFQNQVMIGGCDGQFRFIDLLTGTQTQQAPINHYMPATAGADSNLVYFGHVGNAVTAVELKTAKILWSFPSGTDAFFSSPAIGSDMIYIGCRDKNLYALTKAHGQLGWKFSTGGEVDSSPVLIGKFIAFGSDDGNLYVLEQATGKKVWSYDIGDRLNGSPAASNGQLFIGSEDGALYVFGRKSPE